MGSEDVGLFTLDGKIPGVMYGLGAADPVKLEETRKTGVPLPVQHSPLSLPFTLRPSPQESQL
jgi:hippurate hydrolase